MLRKEPGEHPGVIGLASQYGSTLRVELNRTLVGQRLWTIAPATIEIYGILPQRTTESFAAPSTVATLASSVGYTTPLGTVEGVDKALFQGGDLMPPGPNSLSDEKKT